MVDNRIVAGFAGVFGVISLLLLYLLNRKRPRKRRDSEHVETSKPFEQLPPETILFRYLYDQYWFKKYPDIIDNIPESLTRSDFKQITRITRSDPPMLTIYSKKSVWELGLSDVADKGLREKFYFVLRGPKLSSDEDRKGRFEFVMKDLVEFRQAMKQELLEHKDHVNSLQLLSKQVPPIKERKGEMKTNKKVKAVCDYQQSAPLVVNVKSNLFQTPIKTDEEYLLEDNSDHHEWKVKDKSDESLVPSVCFVIPAPDSEAIDLATRIEIQYKHLLTLWRNRHWHLKQALASSGAFSGVEVVHPIAGEKIVEPEFLASGGVDIEELLRELGDHAESIDEENADDEVVKITQQWTEEEIPMPVQDENITESEPEPLQLADDDTYQQPPKWEEEIDQSADRLLGWLESVEKMLKSKDKVAVDVDIGDEEIKEANVALQQMADNQEEFENVLEKQVDVSGKQLQYKITVLMEKWSHVSTKLHQWQKRLEKVQVILKVATQLDDWLCSAEQELVEQPGFTAEPSQITGRLGQLKDIMASFSSSRTDAGNLREASQELSDVELNETNSILQRWDAALNETQCRVEKLKITLPRVTEFVEALDKQLSWLEETKRVITDDIPGGPDDLPAFMDRYTTLYDELHLHRKPIQKVYSSGEDFLSQSEIYEAFLDDFRFSVQQCEAAPDLYEESKASREDVIDKLQTLSQLHEYLLKEVPRRIELIMEETKQQTTPDEAKEKEAMQFIEKIDKLIVWVEKAEQRLAKETMSIGDDLRIETVNQKTLLTDIRDQEDTIDTALSSGRRYLQASRTELSPEQRMVLDTKMTSLQLQWEKLQSECEGRNKKLDIIHDMLMKFEGTLNPFLAWLQSAEEQSACFHINAPDYNSVKDLLHKHQVIYLLSLSSLLESKRLYSLMESKEKRLIYKKSITTGKLFLAEAKSVFWGHAYHRICKPPVSLRDATVLDIVNLAFQKELENYLANVPEAISSSVGSSGQTWVLEQRLHSINDRYRKLLRAVQFKSNLINESLTKHHDYEEKVSNFTPWLDEAQQMFTTEFQQHVPSDAKKIQKKLDVIKAFRTSVEERHSELVSIKMAAEVLSGLDKQDVKHAIGCYITAQPPGTWIRVTTTLVKRYEELTINITSYYSKLQTVLITVQNFKDGVDSMLKWSEQTKKTFDRMITVSFEIYILQQQIKEVKLITLDIEGHKPSVNSLNVSLDEKRRESGVQRYLDKMQKINKHFGELELKATKRKDDIVAVYHKIVITFEQWLVTVIKKLDSGELISTDILEFEENLTKITEDVEAHRMELQLINQCGHELINLEKNRKESHLLPILDSVNRNWQVAAIHLINHSRRFDEVVKCSEKYHGIRQPLAIWLDKMEGRLLMNDTFNHKGTVEILTHISKQLTSIVQKEGQEFITEDFHLIEQQRLLAIEEEVTLIRGRFDDIVTILEARGRNIDVTLSQADRYSIVYNEVIMRLESAERFQLKQRPISENLEELHSSSKRFIWEAAEVSLVLDCGSELIGGRTTTHGADDIQNQIDYIASKWKDINQAANERQSRLEEAIAKAFHRDITSLQLWIEKTEKDADAMAKKRPRERELEIYITELVIEIRKYEHILYVIHLIANDLIQSGEEDARQIESINQSLIRTG
eukprot:gene4519-5115_t